ncbi:transcriptional repressor [Mesobacterium pallidum]|uniref:transcriptional repressor n=1 Tax=Mesobacterium pallidum TaxID=2872037 RepID=UPI001EE26122|nr:transcriptional repressor [Mesobacterium pallidum]
MDTDPSLGFARHDHATCVGTALAQAERLCADRGLRLTPTRRRALEILLEGHAAMGAYDILERFSAEGLGDKPPVAYRALGFLVDNGFAHRIERLNAYVACTHPGDAHDPAFLICRDCGTVGEALTEARALQQAAKAAGFRIDQRLIEAEGLCPTCQDKPA